MQVVPGDFKREVGKREREHKIAISKFTKQVTTTDTCRLIVLMKTRSQCRTRASVAPPKEGESGGTWLTSSQQSLGKCCSSMAEIPRHFRPGPTKRRLLWTDGATEPPAGDDTTEHAKGKWHGEADRALAAPATKHRGERSA